MDLRKVNLNLLVHLHLLLEEQSVTKASERAFITQTAMSNILKQLRELFDDPLLVRVGRELKPTPKGLELKESLKQCLSSIDKVLESSTFDPAHDFVNMKLAIHSHGEFIILPALCDFLEDNAPHFSLHALLVSEQLNIDNLLATELDFVIAPGFLQTGHEIITKPLFVDKACCVMHSSHPLADKPLTKNAYVRAEHIDVSFSFSGRYNILDDLLLKQGVKRTIKVVVPNMISAIRLMKKNDYLVALPEKLVHSVKDDFDLVVKPFPFPLNSFQVKLFYHRRLENHPPLQWLISQITHLFGEPSEVKN